MAVEHEFIIRQFSEWSCLSNERNEDLLTVHCKAADCSRSHRAN
jgi:hypothetical protein